MNTIILLLLSIVPIETIELQAVEFIHHVHTDESGWVNDDYYVIIDNEPVSIVANRHDGIYSAVIQLHGKRTVVHATKMRVVTTKDDKQPESYVSLLGCLNFAFARFKPAIVWRFRQYEIVFAEVCNEQVIVLWDMSNGRERVAGIGLHPFSVQIGGLTNSIALW